jgi:cbb3-type cytochrome oxidase maturation protein
MPGFYLLIWGSWVVFGLVAVWALVWAIGHGQFQDPEAAAHSIFDEDERPGELTDGFPGEGSDSWR